MAKQWRIGNVKSGADLGTFEGETARDALDAMARAAGYADYAGIPPEIAGGNDLRVVEVPHFLAWDMRTCGGGPVDYVLVPEGYDGKYRRLDVVQESGAPRPARFCRRENLEPLRLSTTPDGEVCPHERLIVNTLKTRAAEGGHDLPEIALSDRQPRWATCRE